MSENNLMEQIDFKKNLLNQAIKTYGLNSEEVLKISREVDELISLYYLE